MDDRDLFGVQICGTFLHFFNWIIRINGILSNRYLLIQNQRGCRFGPYIFTALIFNKYSSIVNRKDWLKIKHQPSETLNKWLSLSINLKNCFWTT